MTRGSTEVGTRAAAAWGLLKYVLRDLFDRGSWPEGEGRPRAEDRHAGNSGGKTLAVDISEDTLRNALFEEVDEKVEEVSEESYPASDPSAATGDPGVGRRKRAENVS